MINFRTYEKEGHTFTTHTVTADQIEFLSEKKAENRAEAKSESEVIPW